MRYTAILILVLAFSLGNGSTHAQIEEWKWLSSLQMLDAKTGWAIITEGGSGVVAKGAIGSIVRTTDGGLHWRDVTPHAPRGQRFPQGVVNVQALTRFDAWVLASLVPLKWDGTQMHTSVIFRTHDGGKTWTQVPIPAGAGVMDFVNARDGWSVAGKVSPDPDRVWEPFFDVRRTTDGGRTWTTVGSVKLPSYPDKIVSVSRATGWIIGDTQDDIYVFVTRDGGRTWRQPKLPGPPGVGARLSWGWELPHLLTAHNGVLPVRYDSDKGSGVFFDITRDAGRTWTHTTPLTLPDSPSPDRGIVLGYWGSTFADINHGWVTDGETLYVTIDGGRRWTKIRPRSPFDRPLVGLEFISPLIGWATSLTMERPFLLKTLDGGRTWTSVPYVIVRQ